MGRTRSKRKRDIGQQTRDDVPLPDQQSKKAKRGTGGPDTSKPVSHPLLSELYPHLQTLRDYVLSRLPASSRLRRKKIASVGQRTDNPGKTATEAELAVARLLDSTVVAYSEPPPEAQQDDRWKKWNSFSQKGDESYVTLSDGLAGASFSQTEVVDFAIWLLFSRDKSGERPKNLLCDGFRRDSARKPHGRASAAQGQIPGLFAVYPNNHVRTFKQDPWPQLLLLLGQAGERMMIDLLLDCSIFSRVEAGRDNYQQLSGVPVSDLDYRPHQPLVEASKTSAASKGKPQKETVRSPAEITFVRSRMLYARAALNARGLVHFGLRHIHVFNRLPLKREVRDIVQEEDARKFEEATTRVMMYIFPRQFGLHNVFTSQVDYNQTAQKFQDYTLREEEIAGKFCVASEGTQQFKAHIPKRLRGLPQHLVEKLQVLHDRCSYSKMLEHYCPAQAQGKRPTRASHGTQKQTKTRKKSRPAPQPVQLPQYSSLVELATPIAHVSAFCQAVLAKIIPNDFWGSNAVQAHNRTAFLEKVDHFIRMRRFEQLSLHEVVQDLKINEIDWLAPPNLKGQKCSRPESQKRLEIFLEFLYYIIDSVLIPLIRSNFYVTESTVHKYRLFFFRHDTWRYVAEPAMAALKTSMFEEVKLDEALRILDSRRFGFSQVRLLPKGLNMRPIMNLRRRTLLKGSKKQLGPSINTILSPVASMLKLEKSLRPDKLGSAMFSVGDIYKRIKDFKTSLGTLDQPLYFAKVDVQGAFDSIPQQAVIDLMSTIPCAETYKLVKHVEVKPSELLPQPKTSTSSSSKPLKKWQALAKPPSDKTTFKSALEATLAHTKRNTVFIESVATRHLKTDALMSLMKTHIQDNLVKIGKKFYRQKHGIPQGSVLSSTLCSYFYADLEAVHLPFLSAPDCLLLRLIDDFLLITTSLPKATRFVQTMHAGIPSYGVVVNPSKTLVNFPMSTSSTSSTSSPQPVPRLPPGTTQFPYCGLQISTTTLSISKSRPSPHSSTHRRLLSHPTIFDSLTISTSSTPGSTFLRKLLASFKLNSHLMFYDTSHNTPSPSIVLSNLYSAFRESAHKAWAYVRCLPARKRPRAGLIVRGIEDLLDMAVVLLKSKRRSERFEGYRCEISWGQVRLLGVRAFADVLGRRQAGWGAVLGWLGEEERRMLAMGGRRGLGVVGKVVKSVK